MKPKKFKKLRDYFGIRSLFFCLPILDNYDSIADWKSLDMKVEDYLAMYNDADDDEYEVNLEWLREPMREDQKDRLRNDILEGLTLLKEQWVSEDGALSESRINSLMLNNPPVFRASEPISQCQQNITFYITDAIHKYEEALAVLNGTHNERTSVSPPTLEKDDKRQGPRGTYNTKRQSTVEYFKASVKDAIELEMRNGRTPIEKKIITKAYNALRDKKQSNDRLYAESTLRSWLSAPYRKKLYDEIQQEISNYNILKIK